MQVNPHLSFDGCCEAAFRFYEKCFGAKIETMMPHEGTPIAGFVPAEWHKKILHATLVVGDQILMGADAPPDHYQKPRGFAVSLGINKVSDAERVFGELADGGEVSMPLQETFWADRFGMLTDRFGIPWMINCGKAA